MSKYVYHPASRLMCSMISFVLFVFVVRTFAMTATFSPTSLVADSMVSSALGMACSTSVPASPFSSGSYQYETDGGECGWIYVWQPEADNPVVSDAAMGQMLWVDVLAESESGWMADGTNNSAGDPYTATQIAVLHDFWVENCLHPVKASLINIDGGAVDLSMSNYESLGDWLYLPTATNGYRDAAPTGLSINMHDLDGDGYWTFDDYEMFWDHVIHCNHAKGIDQRHYFDLARLWLDLLPKFDGSSTPWADFMADPVPWSGSSDLTGLGFSSDLIGGYEDEFGVPPHFDEYDDFIDASTIEPDPGTACTCDSMDPEGTETDWCWYDPVMSTCRTDHDADGDSDAADLLIGLKLTMECIDDHGFTTPPSAPDVMAAYLMRFVDPCNDGDKDPVICGKIPLFMSITVGDDPAVAAEVAEEADCDCTVGDPFDIPAPGVFGSSCDWDGDGIVNGWDFLPFVDQTRLCVIPAAGEEDSPGYLQGDSASFSPDEVIQLARAWFDSHFEMDSAGDLTGASSSGVAICTGFDYCDYPLAGEAANIAMEEYFGRSMTIAEYADLYDSWPSSDNLDDANCWGSSDPCLWTAVDMGISAWDPDLPAPSTTPANTKIRAFPSTPVDVGTGDFDLCDILGDGDVPNWSGFAHFIGHGLFGPGCVNPWDWLNENARATAAQLAGKRMAYPCSNQCLLWSGLDEFLGDNGIVADQGEESDFWAALQPPDVNTCDPDLPPYPDSVPPDRALVFVDPQPNPAWFGGCSTCETGSTEDPVNYSTGFKIENAVDLTVALPGRDFLLSRGYSSRYAVLDHDRTGLAGNGWSLDFFRALQSDWDGTSALSTVTEFYSAVPSRGMILFEKDSNGDFLPDTPAIGVINLTTNDAGIDVARLHVPGQLEIDYCWDDTTGVDLPLGAPIEARDTYGNTWQLTYLAHNPAWVDLDEAGFRLAQVDVVPSSQSDRVASILFEYDLDHEGDEATRGFVTRVSVLRYPSAGVPVKTQEVRYTYFDPQWHHERIGVPGDLVQVEHRVLIDDGPVGDHWYSTFTQYRYHTDAFSELIGSTEDDCDGDGFIEIGQDHQLKAVIDAEQIEYAHQKRSQHGFGASPINATAEWLLMQDDAMPVFVDDGNTYTAIELAAKVVERYDDHQVTRQLLNASCGCAGSGDGFSLLLEYDYEETTDGLFRRTKVTESEWVRSTRTATFTRSRYFELADLAFLTLGDSATTNDVVGSYLLYLSAIGNDGTDAWNAVVYDYDASSLQRTHEYTSSAVIYTPDTDGSFSVPFSSSAYQFDYTFDYTGLAYEFGYSSDANDPAGSGRRLTSTAVSDGTGGSAFAFDVLSEIDYGSTGTSGQRSYLPTEVRRYVDTASTPTAETVQFQYSFHMDGASETDGIEWVEVEVDGEDSRVLYTHEYFDTDGFNAWSRAADDSLSTRTFNVATGAVVTMTANAPTTGLPTTPSSSTMTSTDGTWSGRHSDGGDLETSIETDLLGRVVSATSPDGVSSQIVRQLRTSPDRPGAAYYTEATIPYTWENGGGTEVYSTAPLSISWFNASGASFATRDYALGIPVDEDVPFSESLDYALIETARSVVDHHLTGLVQRTRSWGDLSIEGDDSPIYETVFEYDERGRIDYVVNPNGSVAQPTYDFLDRPLTASVGTMGTSAPENMVLVSETRYDGSTDGSVERGNGVVTKQIRHIDSSTTRETALEYDHRDRLVLIDAPETTDWDQSTPTHDGPDVVIVYDHANRVISEAVHKDGTNATRANRLAYTTYVYNERGLPWSSTTYSDPTASNGGEALESFVWYDPVGRPIAAWGPNQPATKTIFDGLGRPTSMFVVDRPGDDETEVDSVSDDIVIEESVVRYVDDPPTTAGQIKERHGKVDLLTQYVRAHDAPETSLGALSALAAAYSVKTFQGATYDGAGRLETTINFGTNGTTNVFETASGSAPDPTQTPSARDLVSQIVYGDFGLPEATIDPTGMKTQIVYDSLYRQKATIENITSFDPATHLVWDGTNDHWTISGYTRTANDVDRVTSVAYDLADHIVRRVSHGGTEDGGDQVTTYSTARSDAFVESSSPLAFTNDAVTKITYAGESKSVQYGFNRAGEVIRAIDQNDTLHSYTFDEMGRPIVDAVTLDFYSQSTASIDDDILAIAVRYGDAGLPTTVTSLDGTNLSTASVVNDVEFEYTDLFQIERIYQAHSGAVNTSTTPSVAYAYETIGTSGSTPAYPSNLTQSNFSRPTSFTFPSGDSISIGYEDGGIGGAIKLNDRISRPQSLGDARYEYLGLQGVSMVDFVTPDVQLNYNMPSNGDVTAGSYPGFDRFGRIIRQLWIDGDFTTGPSSSFPDRPAIVELAYQYDKAGNILAKIDDRQGSLLRSNQNMVFEYDGLHRLKTAFVGKTSATTSNGETTYAMSYYAKDDSQRWDLSVLGNHISVEHDTAGDGFQTAGDTVESTFNAVNEIATISFDGGSTTPAFTYDDAGNLVEEVVDGSGTVQTYVHDAWNRLVEVVDGTTGYPIARYDYNGLHWRIRKQVETDATPDDDLEIDRRMFYDANWRIVAEEIDDDGDNTDDRAINYVWGLRGLDDLLYREVSTDLSNDGSGSLVIEDTWYHLTDHQLSTVAIITDTGVVAERVRYDAYGKAHYVPEADVNMDGTRNSADQSLIQTIMLSTGGNNEIDGALYTAEADLNRDGIVDIDDYNLWPSSGAMTEASLPDGDLSSTRVDSIIGYCGYVFNAETQDYTVRFRTYDPERGRWLERDPAGFVDGGSLYEYVQAQALSQADPTGLEGERRPVPEKTRRAPGSDLKVDHGPYATENQNYNEDSGNVRAHDDCSPTDTDRWMMASRLTYRTPRDYMWQSLKHGAVSLAHEAAKEAVIILVEQLTGAIVLHIAGKAVIVLVRRADGLYDAFKDGKRLANGVECFAAGTMVMSEEGLVPIEELEAGDRVATLDEESGEVVFREVEFVSRSTGTMLELVVEDSVGNEETIVVTPGHAMLLESGEWTRVCDLNVGDRLHAADGLTASVVAVNHTSQQGYVYNLEVAEHESYFVGFCQICAHNAGDALDCSDAINELVDLTVEGGGTLVRSVNHVGKNLAGRLPDWVSDAGSLISWLSRNERVLKLTAEELDDLFFLFDLLGIEYGSVDVDGDGAGWWAGRPHVHFGHRRNWHSGGKHLEVPDGYVCPRDRS